MTRFRSMVVAFGVGGVLALGGCGEGGSAGVTEVSADGRCEHEIKADICPFCHPEMVQAEGFCGEHGVEEALCALCRPYVKAAFRAKGDWCEEHKLPDSQCLACHPEIAEKIRPGVHGGAMPGADGHGHDHDRGDAALCEHGVAADACGVCNP